MNIVAQQSKTVAQRYFDLRYSLYAGNQPIEACHNEDMRCGWNNAQRGHMAAIAVEAVFAAGGNGRDADYALQGGW